MQSREARCVNQVTNSTVAPRICKDPSIGPLFRPCNIHQCPTWRTGAWAGVVSCFEEEYFHFCVGIILLTLVSEYSQSFQAGQIF